MMIYWKIRIRRTVLATLLAQFAVLPLGAQNVVAPLPQYSVAPPAMQDVGRGQSAGFTSAGAESQELTQPFQFGPVTLRPHLFYRFLYGTGIQASTNDSVDTAIHEFAPGFLLELGRHWTLDYTPSWKVYSSDKFNNTLDHNVKLTGGTTYEDWVLGLSQSFSKTSEPLAETAAQTEQQTYLTTANASYRFNNRMSADFAVNQTFNHPDSQTSTNQLVSSSEWSTLDWLNYQFWPRLDGAFGVGFGYTDVETGTDMTYEQIRGRLRWHTTDKISLEVNGGVEDRQFLDGSRSDAVNPVFGAVIQYQPFEHTLLTLGANGSVDTSLSEDQVRETRSVQAGLQQRLLEKLQLGVGGSYRSDKYTSSTSGSASDRTDDYYSFDVRLTRDILKRGNIAVFYQYSDNSSTEPGFSYYSTQFAVELSYRY